MAEDAELAGLLSAASAARKRAYAPYSRFAVGVALLADDGHIYSGCNVENAAYPEGTCAEAGAIAAMILGGGARILRAVVMAESPLPCTPCGGCRQKLSEFAGPDMAVVMANEAGPRVTMTIGELLPGAFGDDHMRKEKG